MNKKWQNEAVRLTQEVLSRFWQLDVDFALQHCAPDVVWIGSEQTQFMQGLPAMERDFLELSKSLVPCHLLNQEFAVVQNEANVCTVVGRYLTTTDSTVDYFLQVQQRCTCVWRLFEGRLQIEHLHVSNPMGELKVAENERFVGTMGKMAQHYLFEKVKSMTNHRRLSVTNTDGDLCFVAVSELMWVAANRKHAILHTVNGEIETRQSFAEMEAQLDESFVCVHRSYIVNINFVQSIRHNVVAMLDGNEVPIPARRYEEVRQTLMKQHDASELV